MSFIILSTSTTRAKAQHMMCGALTPQKQDLNNSLLTQLRNAKVTFSFSYKPANVLTPITPFHSLTPSRKHYYYFQHVW